MPMVPCTFESLRNPFGGHSCITVVGGFDDSLRIGVSSRRSSACGGE